MPILPLTPKLQRSQNDVVLVLESGVKLALHQDFLYGMGKVRKPNFDKVRGFECWKSICKSGQSSGGVNEVSPFFFLNHKQYKRTASSWKYIYQGLFRFWQIVEQPIHDVPYQGHHFSAQFLISLRWVFLAVVFIFLILSCKPRGGFIIQILTEYHSCTKFIV